MQSTELEQQISNELELTNEMNSLLVQRACRIEELEKTLASYNSTDGICNSEIQQQVEACTVFEQSSCIAYLLGETIVS